MHAILAEPPFRARFHRLPRSAFSLSAHILLVIGSWLTLATTGYAACNIVDGKAYGDCAGVQINAKPKGRLTVRSYVLESGIIDGATVLNGGRLDLSGISNGDIQVQRGGRLRVTGVVSGNVTCNGGSVEIEGTIGGLHSEGGDAVIGGIVGSVSGSARITYKKGAVIGGIPVEKTTKAMGAK